MKRIFGLVLTGLLFVGLFSNAVVAGGDSIRVMTQNQYLGADLTPFFTALADGNFLGEAAAALQQIALNNFRIRARRFATEVKLTDPDVIALQEVFDFSLNGGHPEPPFLDHLEETLDALAARGLNYVVAAAVKNFDLTIPLDLNGDFIPESVRVFDRDVILVREGVSWENLSGSYSTSGLCGVPIENPAFDEAIPELGPEYLQSIPSEYEYGDEIGDGCNYTVVVQVPSPIDFVDPLEEPVITIKRGFVGVDVTVRGKDYRIVNTHLEQNQIGDDPGTAIFQTLQAVELIGTLLATTPSDLPLILMGDFNSSLEDEPFGLIDPPYQIISGAGFADIWDTNRFAFFDPGYTCCQAADLANRRSQLDERIDLIFVRDASFLSYAFVVGRVPIFPRFFPPNWASDHAGVFAKLIFRQDEMGWLYGRWSRRH